MDLTRRTFVEVAGAATILGALGMGHVASATPASGAGDSSPADREPVPVEQATIEEVRAILGAEDSETILIDARPQEIYAGWALEGAPHGGHLRGAKLFSARWLDCEYAEEAPRRAYLDRSMEGQGIAAGTKAIVYDYTGAQAEIVAQYLAAQGVDARYATVAELIDEGGDLESFEHHDRLVPVELVKSVSDVKAGKASELTPEAQAVFGDVDNIALFDVGWGNVRTSTYLSSGHVPGAVHINTDSYERPRVYVPEKRPEYAQEWRLIPVEELRDTVCVEYGITKDTVIILTSGYSTPPARLGFMLRSLGVRVYVMVGALVVWRYNGYELDTDPSTIVVPTAAESFGSDDVPAPDEILWMDDIKAILDGTMPGQVIDNRSKGEWDGTDTGYSYHDIAGRIEGSIWVPQEDPAEGGFFQNPDCTPRTPEEYAWHIESYGADPTQVMAFFCGDSWGAARNAYWCQSVDMMAAMQWGNGWMPWSNEGNWFIDHTGARVRYERYRDTVIDEDGNDVADGVNLKGDEPVA